MRTIAVLGVVIVAAQLQSTHSAGSMQLVRGRSAPLTGPESSIDGVVISPRGPEAGVSGIAETNDLPTNCRKIVITEDQGRFLLPDLLNANDEVWVRGYSLVGFSAN